MGRGTRHHHNTHNLNIHIPYMHLILCLYIPHFPWCFSLRIPSNRLEGEIGLLIFIYIFTGYIVIHISKNTCNKIRLLKSFHLCIHPSTHSSTHRSFHLSSFRSSSISSIHPSIHPASYLPAAYPCLFVTFSAYFSVLCSTQIIVCHESLRQIVRLIPIVA